MTHHNDTTIIGHRLDALDVVKTVRDYKWVEILFVFAFLTFLALYVYMHDETLLKRLGWLSMVLLSFVTLPIGRTKLWVTLMGASFERTCGYM